MTKYCILTTNESAYFVPNFTLSEERIKIILPQAYEEDYVIVVQQPSTLVTRESFIQERDLWHRVLDTVWYPDWNDWQQRNARWNNDKQLTFYIKEVDEANRIYCYEIKQAGWFVDLSEEDIKELRKYYTVKTHLSDSYKQADEFLMVLEIY